MRTEPREPRRKQLLKRHLRDPAANLIDLAADHPKHDPRGLRIGVEVERPRRAVLHREVPMPMRPAGPPMDGLRGLHQVKLLDAMAAPVVLDERGDGHMNRQ